MPHLPGNPGGGGDGGGDDPVGPPGAAVAANDPNLNLVISKSKYDKMATPVLPHPGGIPDWMSAIGEQLVTAGGFTDQLELQWLNEIFYRDIVGSGGWIISVLFGLREPWTS